MATAKPLVTPEEALAKEEQALRRKWTQLLRRYEGEYIALYQGRVIGHGPDDEELAKQLFEQLGDLPFYIARIEKDPTVYELPSPEVVR